MVFIIRVLTTITIALALFLMIFFLVLGHQASARGRDAIASERASHTIRGGLLAKQWKQQIIDTAPLF